MIRKKVLQILSGLFLVFSCQAQQEILLYQDEIPNARNVPDRERIVERGENDQAIFATSIPTLTVFSPEDPTGKSVIICPGGGYVKTAFDKEGTLVAKELVKEGITAFVLKYRIPQDLTNVDKSLAPLQDAQQAIRYVRKNAEAHQLDPQQIGMMGFSAGGHLAASAATHFHENADTNETDTTSVRPDFVILIYPVISFSDELTHAGSRNQLIGENPKGSTVINWSNEKQLTADSPPAFLVHAADDKAVPVGNSLAYYAACIEHDIPVEMHLYPSGGHGFGMFNPTISDSWMDRLTNWLITPTETIDSSQASKRFTIENCVNQFDIDKTIQTKLGYQYWFVDKDFLDGRTLKMSVVKPNDAEFSPHHHEGDEFFYILEGTAEFYLNGATVTKGANTSFYCPPGSMHGIRNIGDEELKSLVIKKYPNKN